MTRKLSELDAASSSPIFRIGVFALIFDEGRLLLGHRRDIDWWNLPGGGMEAGEIVDEALRREVREETGLEAEIEQLVGRSRPPKRIVRTATLRRMRYRTIRSPNTASVLRTLCSISKARSYEPNAAAQRRIRGCSLPDSFGVVPTTDDDAMGIGAGRGQPDM